MQDKTSINPSSVQLSPQLQQVADYFIAKSAEAGRPLTNKKLQKLAYYAQAWSLVFNNDQPIFNEPIEAWIHGPAIRSLYNKYKSFGFNGISVKATEPTFTPPIQQVMSDVWTVYGKYDGNYLETLTHGEQPWIEARGNAEVNQPTNIIISLESMSLFYAQLYREAQARRTSKA